MLEQLRPSLLGRRGERLPLFGGLGLGLVVLSVVVTATLRDPKSLDAMEDPAVPGSVSLIPASSAAAAASASPDAVTVEPDTASSAVLDHATTLDDVEKLAVTYPNDPKVQRKLLLLYSDDQHALPQALPVALRLLSLMPGAAQDDVVRHIISKGASGPPSVAEAAFQAMQSGMGNDGPDLLWDLAEGGGNVAVAVKDRANKALLDPKVRELMSPALRVAFDLRAMSACQRKTLLPTVEKDGDKRSIPFLEALVGTRSCGLLGLRTCYTCPGSPAAGQQAIASLKSRSK